MKVKLLEVLLSIVLGFFTGILLSGNGIEIRESGIQILLACIFWMLTFIYGSKPVLDELINYLRRLSQSPCLHVDFI